MRSPRRTRELTYIVGAGILLVTSCGDADRERVGSTASEVVIVDNALCRVELLKIEYDQPGTDTGDYVELFVSQKGGLVTSLQDCGVGAMVLYDSGSCLTPYLTVPLQAVVIPSDGYIEICNGTGCDVSMSSGDFLHNGPAEIGFLGATLPAQPLIWISYEGPNTCVPPLTSPPTFQAQTETDASPNQTNIWCGSAFVLAASSTVTKRAPNPCADAGTGGTGGTGATDGGAATGGTGAIDGGAATGGTGATDGGAATGGTGATDGGAATGGTGATDGGAATGGTGATDGGAATGGTGATDGGAATGGTGATDGGAATGGAGATDGGAATGGTGATGGGAATGGTGGGAASGGSGGGAASGGTGGGGATAGTGAKGGSGATGTGAGGLGLDDIAVEGGGCACSVRERASLQPLAFLALVFAVARRRRNRRV